MPSRDICYAYAVAMYFAQQFEINLRAFLYTCDYHGWIEDIKLSEEERKRFKNSNDFIDEVTCGRLLRGIREASVIKGDRAFKAFERACKHRNRLAHNFLVLHEFGGLTKEQENKIIREIYDMTADLYGALVISRAIRDNAEVEADNRQEIFNQMAREIEGTDGYDDPKRKYTPRRKS